MKQSDFDSAKTLVRRLGESLIGRTVWTPAIGYYPGGEAVVTEIAPDPKAPDIVFQVEHPREGTMGIFDYERVRLVK